MALVCAHLSNQQKVVQVVHGTAGRVFRLEWPFQEGAERFKVQAGNRTAHWHALVEIKMVTSLHAEQVETGVVDRY